MPEEPLKRAGAWLTALAMVERSGSETGHDKSYIHSILLARKL